MTALHRSLAALVLCLSFPVALARAHSGNGADGAITIPAATTRNINTQAIAAGRTTPDGEAFAVTALGLDTIRVTGAGTGGTAAASLATSIAPGDEVLLINLRGDATNHDNVGNYEFRRVAAVTAD